MIVATIPVTDVVKVRDLIQCYPSVLKRDVIVPRWRVPSFYGALIGDAQEQERSFFQEKRARRGREDSEEEQKDKTTPEVGGQ